MISKILQPAETNGQDAVRWWLPRYADQEQRPAVVERFYAIGDLWPLYDLLEWTWLKVFDNRDLCWNNELVVKTAFLATLFNDTFTGWTRNRRQGEAMAISCCGYKLRTHAVMGIGLARLVW